jgi:hypothetical protein
MANGNHAMQGKLLGVQMLEAYNMEVSCGQEIKVLSFQGVVERPCLSSPIFR